jgi:hypothetical protein
MPTYNDWLPGPRTEIIEMCRTWIEYLTAARRTAWGCHNPPSLADYGNGVCAKRKLHLSSCGGQHGYSRIHAALHAELGYTPLRVVCREEGLTGRYRARRHRRLRSAQTPPVRLAPDSLVTAPSMAPSEDGMEFCNNQTPPRFQTVRDRCKTPML